KIASFEHDATRVVLDGSSKERVLDAEGIGELTLQDLTVQHGWASPYGGGLVVDSDSLVIDGCDFADNIAVAGGGISARAAALWIVDSLFERNTTGETGLGGGALSVYGSGYDLSVDDTRFEAN